MYGDADVIRALARTLREQGSDIRSEADALVGRADAVPWTGLAAEAMRHLARDHAGCLRTSAARHEDAAEALERHAREVDHLQAVIAAVERRFTHLLHGVGGVGGVVHAVTSRIAPDAVDDWLAHVEPPAHGSMAWLDVHVPRSA
jgi:hypothetical protein